MTEQRSPLAIPNGWTADQVEFDFITIGESPTGDPITVPDHGNIYLWGPRGAGATTLTRLLIAAAALRPDTLVWLIDPDGLFTAREFVAPLLAGETTAPAVDWVATTTHDALHMVDAALRLARSRMQLPDEHDVKVQIVFASGSGLFGFNGQKPADEYAAATVETLGQLAPISDTTKVNYTIAANRYLAGMMPGTISDNIQTFIAVGTVQPHEFATAFGEHVTADQDRTPGHGRVGNRNSHTEFQGYLITREQVREVAGAYTTTLPEVDDDTAETLGTAYAHRWVETLHKLADGQPIPAALAGLGWPSVPDDLTKATHRQLTYGLRQAVADSGPQHAAAAEILIRSCAGRLLTSYAMSDSGVLYAENGQLYVRWNNLAGIADYTAFRQLHPDAPIMLRLAGHLATGGFTPANVSALIDALIIADPEEE